LAFVSTCLGCFFPKVRSSGNINIEIEDQLEKNGGNSFLFPIDTFDKVSIGKAWEMSIYAL
jgi:hypothetical protein